MCLAAEAASERRKFSMINPSDPMKAHESGLFPSEATDHCRSRSLKSPQDAAQCQSFNHSCSPPPPPGVLKDIRHPAPRVSNGPNISKRPQDIPSSRKAKIVDFRRRKEKNKDPAGAFHSSGARVQPGHISMQSSAVNGTSGTDSKTHRQ